MKEINSEGIKQHCPYHEGLCGFAKVAGPYCTKQCPFYCGLNPNNGKVYCNKENDEVDWEAVNKWRIK